MNSLFSPAARVFVACLNRSIVGCNVVLVSIAVGSRCRRTARGASSFASDFSQTKSTQHTCIELMYTYKHVFEHIC